MIAGTAPAAVSASPPAPGGEGPDPAALTATEFAATMAALGPWPARPSLAVAVSGGRDSLALALLLAAWLAPRQGRLLALTVDHRLRAGSAREAAWTGERLARHGIPHRILPWRGGVALPAGRPVQAAARAARYRLLAAACREAGLPVLCLAHQADDQAETLLLRLAADSGPLGLAGMSARRAEPDVLLLRPLLGIARDRLTATLRAAGETWLDDPSNDQPRHRRVALRQARPALESAGLDGRRLAALGEGLGRLRVPLERQAAALLASGSAWHPGGFVRLDRAVFAAAPEPLAVLALGELVRGVGGRDYPPPAAAIGRALAALRQPGARGSTLGGLRLLPRRDEAFLFPESGRLAPLELEPGFAGRWGRTFEAALAAEASGGPFSLRALGPAGWQALAGDCPAQGLPGPLLAALPALFDSAGPRLLPALGWQRRDSPPLAFRLRYRPLSPLGNFGFTVACRERHII